MPPRQDKLPCCVRGRHQQHHSRRNESENRDPQGSGQPGDLFNSHYPPYHGSSASSYASQPPFSTVKNYGHATRLPALTTIVNVDELSAEYGLDNTQRKAAHSFSKLAAEDRAVTMYLRVLHTEQQNKAIKEQLQGLQTKLEAIEVFCTQNWKPSSQQLKWLKSLLRHYIIRPITSYSNVVPLAESYIQDHAKRLHLELYKQDPTVKTVVHELLTVENNNVRSALRKLVFTSVSGKVSLMSFGRKVVNGYHLPTIPATPPNDILACLALMRKVARPLVSKETSRGGDTGFGGNMEKELDVFFEKNGNVRDSPSWREWEKEIIVEDNRRYLRHGAPESSVRSQAEINAAAAAAAAGPPPRGPAAAADAAPNNGQGDEDEMDGRDVHLSVMGDLGSLSVGPVART